MNPSISPEANPGLAHELREFLSLGEDILTLATRENQSLTGHADYEPDEFHQRRKSLLQPIDLMILKLRQHRVIWQQSRLNGRAHSEEIKSLFQNIQNLLMKILLLDRENQQAMLRRGLVPAAHLPAAAGQRPHFVAGLYQRFSTR
jgi:hypothetical protein